MITANKFLALRMRIQVCFCEKWRHVATFEKGELDVGGINEHERCRYYIF